MKRFFSLFTGFDGAGEGARQAGYAVVGGVEFHPDLAYVAQQNHPESRVIINDVRAVDYAAIATDHLHASPSCKKASIANADRGETAEDIETARAVCRAIREMRPSTFTLENVRGYAAFDAYALIIGTLHAAGYGVAAGVLNAADYGVAQTRERLIVVAVRGLPSWAVSLPPATHAKRRDQGGQLALFDAPPLPPWVGWYEAIEDLIPTLPPSQFAPWQMARLPAEVRGSLFIDKQYGDPTSIAREDRRLRTRDYDEPVTPVMSGRLDYRAFIVDGQKAGNPDGERGVTVRHGDAPMYTVTSGTGAARPARAWLVDGKNVNQEYGKLHRTDSEPSTTVSIYTRPSHLPRALVSARAWLTTGRVVQMTPRALSRLQSFPDSYTLPEKASLACEGIGNAVPPLLMRRIMEHVKRLEPA